MKILALPGDGIGPEITDATLGLLAVVDKTLRLGLSIEKMDIGLVTLDREGTTLPARVMKHP